MRIMTKRVLRYILFATFLGVFISSCRVTQPYQVPEISTEGLFRDGTSSDTNSIANLPWQSVFQDETLQELITRGLSHNPDLLSAYIRIQQAEAYYNQSRAAFLPDLSLSAGVTESKVPQSQRFDGNSARTLYNVGLSTVWEADIWGRLSSSKRAEFANLLQTEAAARAIQTRLISTIATYYYSLMAMDQQLQITEKTIRNWDTTVVTMRALKEAATVTEAAVVQSEAQRYAAEVTIPDLNQAIRETENALSILIGSAPGEISRGELFDKLNLVSVETGVPSQLLANRPDVMQAELNFRSQFELTNVARAAFYPSLAITASGGYNSLDINSLFDPASLIASIGGSLTQPIFNRRANKTRLEVAVARQREALLNFQNTLLTAGKEVSDALSLYETARQKTTVRAKQTDALRKSVAYSQELLENGFANYTEVITARQSLLQAELASIDDRLQQLRATIDLYRSLGGGWK